MAKEYMNAWILVPIIAVITVVVVGAERWNRHLARKHMANRPQLTSVEFGKAFYPAAPEVAAQVRDILEKSVKVDLSRLQPTDQPVRDLNLGAIDAEAAVDVVLDIEEHFHIKVDDAAAEKMRTVDDVIQYVIAAVEERRQTGQPAV